MFYPLTVNDFLHRAVEVFPDRTAVHDEPLADQQWEPLTYRDLTARARSLAASLDALDVPQGGRVAILSQNSARMLTSFYGVSGFGRILVPINFRLTAAEVAYIIEHSGADVLLADPSLNDVVDAVDCKHKFVFGENDALLWTNSLTPREWTPDETATATINYTSGTTARPKGVQLTHRNLWLNAVTFGWHLGVNEEEVYLHTLPMFHANGWGMPYAITGFGGTHIVLRQVDGAEILRRVERHGVTLMCGAPAVLAAILDAAEKWDGAIPGRDRVRVVVAGAPPPTRLIERIREELGWEFIQIYGLTETSPFLTMSRMRREWRTFPTASRLASSDGRGHPRSASSCPSTRMVRCSSRATTTWTRTGRTLRRRRLPNAVTSSTQVTAARSSTATSPSRTARRTSSSPVARTSPRSRSKTFWPVTRRSRK